jgi:hypothetical protein
MHFDTLFSIQGQSWLATCQPTAHAALQCDFDAAGAVCGWMVPLGPPIGDRGPNPAPKCQVDSWLRDISPLAHIQLLLGFAAQTCTGFFRKGRQVTAQSVEKALCCSHGTSLCAGGIPRPLLRCQLTFLKSYQDRNPAPRPQVALPIHAIDLAAAARNDMAATPCDCALARLIILVFYFLLQLWSCGIDCKAKPASKKQQK